MEAPRPKAFSPARIVALLLIFVTALGLAYLHFGRGADGATCACDAAKDGVTNPEPIDGNTRMSLSADDDGGFFKEHAHAYYKRGALRLP